MFIVRLRTVFSIAAKKPSWLHAAGTSPINFEPFTRGVPTARLRHRSYLPGINPRLTTRGVPTARLRRQLMSAQINFRRSTVFVSQARVPDIWSCSSRREEISSQFHDPALIRFELSLAFLPRWPRAIGTSRINFEPFTRGVPTARLRHRSYLPGINPRLTAPGVPTARLRSRLSLRYNCN